MTVINFLLWFFRFHIYIIITMPPKKKLSSRAQREKSKQKVKQCRAKQHAAAQKGNAWFLLQWFCYISWVVLLLVMKIKIILFILCLKQLSLTPRRLQGSAPNSVECGLRPSSKIKSKLSLILAPLKVWAYKWNVFYEGKTRIYRMAPLFGGWVVYWG